MATTLHEAHEEERRALGIIAGGAGVKTVGGIAVAVLAILALIGIIPRMLIEISGIVFGAAMLLEGISIGSEYRKLAQWVAETRSERIEVGGGTGIEILVGVAAIAMGVLSLLGIAASSLMPALIITGGAGLILAAGTLEGMKDLRLMADSSSDVARRVSHDSMGGGAALEVLGGVAAVVLGILSLVMLPAFAAEGTGTLPQVGMLVLGLATAAGGGVLAGRSTVLYRDA
jgi:hypothetical protein